MIKIIIPGEPVAQPRPRFTRYGKPYYPDNITAYRQSVEVLARLAMRGRPPLAGALAMSVQVVRGVPKSWAKSRKAAALLGKVLPISRPDLSNYVKGLEDAMNGIVWADDSVIVESFCSKRYGADPCVIVKVWELGERKDDADGHFSQATGEQH